MIKNLLTPSRPRQLTAAAACGFQVPPTLFTNNAFSVLQEESLPNTLIYKTHNFFVFPLDGVLFTSRTAKSEVNLRAHNVAVAPGIYQPFIEKSHELRITVVGQRVYPARVNSQEREATRIDWREDQDENMFEATTLEASFEQKLLELQKCLGLRFGVYDFIVDTAGVSWFLEVNPVGQYLWLERRLGLPVSAGLALELLA